MKRSKFYFLILLISFSFGGFLPMIWGMFAFYAYIIWFLIFIIDVILFLIYEFKHLPEKDKINFEYQKRLSVVYFIFMLFYYSYTIIMFVLNGKINYRQSTTIFFILVILTFLNYLYYKFSENLKSVSQKLGIIVKLFMIVLFIWGVISIPENIRAYKSHRDSFIFEISLDNNDFEKCLSVRSESFCKKKLSIRYNNIELCLETADSSDGDYRDSIRYQCLYAIAQKKLDEKICDLMDQYVKDKWGTRKQDCKDKISLLKKKEKQEN